MECPPPSTRDTVGFFIPATISAMARPASRAVYEDFYGRYDDGAMFCDLTAYIPTDNLSKYEFYGDGNKAVLLSSLRLGSLPELEKLPEDTVLCLRCPNDSSALGIGNGEEVFRRSEAVIRKIFELD